VQGYFYAAAQFWRRKETIIATEAIACNRFRYIEAGDMLIG
jgi:hypothetical protein